MLRRGRDAGRRDSIILVAEGAADRDGERITAERIQDVLRDKTGEEARITILGHVQRGGTPSAYDRWMATVCGVEAVRQVLQAGNSPSRCWSACVETRYTRPLCWRPSRRPTRSPTTWPTAITLRPSRPAATGSPRWSTSTGCSPRRGPRLRPAPTRSASPSCTPARWLPA
ncbi:hypothetical protein G7085_00910 [Tessaracoccus sp. HDW20]|nr:hypothetical protein [Tessaracoccus coleopterorum]